MAQLGPVGAGAGGLDDEVAAVRCGQRVQLQLVILGSSADAGVADADGVAVGAGSPAELPIRGSSRKPSRNSTRTGRLRDLGFSRWSQPTDSVTARIVDY